MSFSASEIKVTYSEKKKKWTENALEKVLFSNFAFPIGQEKQLPMSRYLQCCQRKNGYLSQHHWSMF